MASLDNVKKTLVELMKSLVRLLLLKLIQVSLKKILCILGAQAKLDNRFPFKAKEASLMVLDKPPELDPPESSSFYPGSFVGLIIN